MKLLAPLNLMTITRVQALAVVLIVYLLLLAAASIVAAEGKGRQYTVGVAYILTRPDAQLCGTFKDASGQERPELSRIVRRKDTLITEFADGRKIRGPISLKSSRRTCCTNGVCAYPKPNVFVE
ncbi:hypothetical protein [Sneathiella limimaris]|uniref:hypothetical protein n=1 Tax=Sneathiella limimaris TaxID=1964213 RepID=UPI00146AFCEF|nr:hypothetical protein [Sneathiella limimaris]